MALPPVALMVPVVVEQAVLLFYDRLALCLVLQPVQMVEMAAIRQYPAHMPLLRQKARVVEAWIAAGKMRPVDPFHFFILLWSATQFYADFDAQARNALGVGRLTRGDFARAAETIVGILAAGCGFGADRTAGSRRRHEPLVGRGGV